MQTWNKNSASPLEVSLLFLLEEGETMRQKAAKNFRASGKNRTHDLRILDWTL